MEWRGLGASETGYVQMAACCEPVNKPSNSIKCGEFVDYPWNG